MYDENEDQEYFGDEQPDLDYVLETIGEIDKDIQRHSENRLRYEQMLAKHRPEMLQRIVEHVERFLGPVGGSIEDLVSALPELAAAVRPQGRSSGKSGTSQKRPRKRSGGWFHEGTGVTYKGGMLPTALATAMANSGVDPSNKDDKKKWIEENCTKLEA